MNLYIRYFDYETLVFNVEEALDFLASIPEIGMNAELEADVRSYVSSDIFFPKRYKLRPRVYFIIIKTTAESMEDFKMKKALNPAQTAKGGYQRTDSEMAMAELLEEREGWYNGQLNFKRVVLKPQSGKFEYKDTHVEYNCKATSGMDCYNRIIDHLKSRVDSRSQFPSVKGKNFKFKYLGKSK